jgi:hypothetical protein
MVNYFIIQSYLLLELKLKELKDFYSVKYEEIVEKGGKSILEHYNDSIFHALRSIYPEFQWQGWKFDKVKTHFWEETKNIDEFITWFSNQIGITKIDDWYNVSFDQIQKYGGEGYYGDFIDRFRNYFIKKQWRINKYT